MDGYNPQINKERDGWHAEYQDAQQFKIEQTYDLKNYSRELQQEFFSPDPFGDRISGLQGQLSSIITPWDPGRNENLRMNMIKESKKVLRQMSKILLDYDKFTDWKETIRITENVNGQIKTSKPMKLKARKKKNPNRQKTAFLSNIHSQYTSASGVNNLNQFITKIFDSKIIIEWNDSTEEAYKKIGYRYRTFVEIWKSLQQLDGNKNAQILLRLLDKIYLLYTDKSLIGWLKWSNTLSDNDIKVIENTSTDEDTTTPIEVIEKVEEAIESWKETGEKIGEQIQEWAEKTKDNVEQTTWKIKDQIADAKEEVIQNIWEKIEEIKRLPWNQKVSALFKTFKSLKGQTPDIVKKHQDAFNRTLNTFLDKQKELTQEMNTGIDSDAKNRFTSSASALQEVRKQFVFNPIWFVPPWGNTVSFDYRGVTWIKPSLGRTDFDLVYAFTWNGNVDYDISYNPWSVSFLPPDVEFPSVDLSLKKIPEADLTALVWWQWNIDWWTTSALLWWTGSIDNENGVEGSGLLQINSIKKNVRIFNKWMDNEIGIDEFRFKVDGEIWKGKKEVEVVARLFRYKKNGIFETGFSYEFPDNKITANVKFMQRLLGWKKRKKNGTPRAWLYAFFELHYNSKREWVDFSAFWIPDLDQALEIVNTAEQFWLDIPENIQNIRNDIVKADKYRGRIENYSEGYFWTNIQPRIWLTLRINPSTILNFENKRK